MRACIRLEIRRAARDPGFVILGVLMPLAIYVFFTRLIPGTEKIALHILTNMAAFGAIGAALNNGTGVAEDRSAGWLRRLRLTPLTLAHVVTAKTITGMLLVLPSIVAVLLAGALVNNVVLSPSRWLSIAALLWLGAVPFILLGLGYGYRLSGQTAGVAAMSTVMGLSIVGGLLWPAEDFPAWLRAVAERTPAHSHAALAREVAGGGAPTTAAVLVSLARLGSN